MNVKPADIADRLSILILKAERSCATPDLAQELAEYEVAASMCNPGIPEEMLGGLLEVNGKIWDLESDIRRGKEGELGLEEVGRRALAIRDLNAERIEIKNRISKVCGGFSEIKSNHASAR